MTFLNPFVLFGLAAAAIPVILHLLNLRKLRTVEFSTLSFLKELQQTKIRRLKFRQILLLLLRTLAILCLVIAFARPALRGALFGKLGGTAHSTVVLIFDDSFSMSASDQFGELFKQAKEKTERLLDLLNEGDEVYLVKLSDLPAATVDPPTHDIQAVRRIIRESSVSLITRPLSEALTLSNSLLARSKNANKEVYVVSDFQQTLFTKKAAERAGSDTAANATGRNYFLVEIGAKPIDNVAVDSVEVTSRIFEPGKPVQISATVRNFSGTPVANASLSAFLDNARAGQSALRIDPWGTATVTMNVTPKHAGIVRGFVELENDAIEQDNRRYFSFTIPEHINVAVIADNARDARFLLLALQAGSTDSTRSAMVVRQVSSQQFPLVDLRSTDVLVVMNASGITGTGVGNVAGFVKRGGGLVIIPAGNAQATEFNPLLSGLGLPPVGGILGNPRVPANLTFRSVDLDHPLFSAIFEESGNQRQQRREEIESPTVAMALQHPAGRSGHDIISMTGGEPFLTEYLSGEGKILMYTVAPSVTWSDFPLKGIFVPLMHRSMVYLASPERAAQQAETGNDALIVVRPSAGGAGAQYSLTAPDGTQEFVQPLNALAEDVKERPEMQKAMAAVPQGLLGFLKPRLSLPGYYDLKRGSTILAVLSVNVDPKESDTRKPERALLAEEWSRRGIKPQIIPSIDRAAELQTVVTQSRFGVELWRYFLAAALLLALIEMFVARDATKKDE